MKEIPIQIKDKIAVVRTALPIVCGNSDYVAVFTFVGDDWAEYPTKTARFVYGNEHIDVVFTGDRCDIPPIPDAPCVEIGVYAGDVKTSTPAYVRCLRSITSGTGSPADPPESVYNQLMEQLKDLGELSDEELAAAIEAYFAENPIEQQPSVLTVAMTYDEETDAYTADKTFDEIYAANENGYAVQLSYDGAYFFLNSIAEDFASFGAAYSADGVTLQWDTVMMSADGSIYFDTVESGEALDAKMDKANPTGTGSFSMNRKSGTTVGMNSHAEGANTIASGYASHAEGDNTIASGYASHAEGDHTTASDYASHAEGRKTTASESYSHAEGSGTIASGYASHAEGFNTTASSQYSHAEGGDTTASGSHSHAEGLYTTASGNCSHAEGSYTTASGVNSHVQGKYNIKDTDSKYAHIVGNGSANAARSNAHTLGWNGVAWFQGRPQFGGNAQDDEAVEVLGTSDIVDNLTSDDTDKPLSAAQGKVLNGKIPWAIPQLFGAMGNGSTDDTAAVQSALLNNRYVYIPAGTYKLSGTLNIRDGCRLELAPDAVLNFTQTSGNCITLGMSAQLNGNFATIVVPYAFSGNVIYISTASSTTLTGVPPFTKWTPQWKPARYVSDIFITKPDSRGFHYSVDGTCSGTAVYIEADGSAISTFIWGARLTGLRIAGAFSYGIHGVCLSNGWNHEMHLEAVIDACEIGISLEDCNNNYITATIQPRAALTTDEQSVPYAKHGIQLIRCRNTDLSGTRVWDWNPTNSLWTATNEYQHISLIGNCSGTILGDFLYYEMPSYDIRSLIYTDTASNLEKITILQEPFTRWFKPSEDGVTPLFYNGSMNKELLQKDEFDALFQTDLIANFDNLLPKATDGEGNIFNAVGYKDGVRLADADGTTETTLDGNTITGFIPCGENDIIRLKGISFATNDYSAAKVILYDSSFTKLMHVNHSLLTTNGSYYNVDSYEATDDGCSFRIVNAAAAYIRLSVDTATLTADPVVTVNEEITYSQAGFLADSVKVKASSVYGLTSGSSGGTDKSLGMTGATVGQIAKITEVDDDGKPTAWEAVELPSGSDEFELLGTLDVSTGDTQELEFDAPMREIIVVSAIIDSAGGSSGANTTNGQRNLYFLTDGLGASAVEPTKWMLVSYTYGLSAHGWGYTYKTIVECGEFVSTGRVAQTISYNGTGYTELFVRQATSNFYYYGHVFGVRMALTLNEGVENEATGSVKIYGKRA